MTELLTLVQAQPIRFGELITLIRQISSSPLSCSFTKKYPLFPLFKTALHTWRAIFISKKKVCISEEQMLFERFKKYSFSAINFSLQPRQYLFSRRL